MQLLGYILLWCDIGGGSHLILTAGLECSQGAERGLKFAFHPSSLYSLELYCQETVAGRQGGPPIWLHRQLLNLCTESTDTGNELFEICPLSLVADIDEYQFLDLGEIQMDSVMRQAMQLGLDHS